MNQMNNQKHFLIEHWKAMGISKKVLGAFMETDRKNFVLENYRDSAYDDIALPIIVGQTISQPTTVIIMTNALELKETDKVLEVGAGSGYQAALIANIVKKGFVYTTEFFQPLIEFAEDNLKKEGIKNARVIRWDGSAGYEKEAPYDKIIVTAACPRIPPLLLEQLKVNGIMVCPVGSRYSQEMLRIKKTEEGPRVKNLGDFIFVPLRGKYGFE